MIDNATFDKGGRIEQLVRAAGCQVWYKPTLFTRLEPD
ncbi:hypothetical protein LYNGBM3L_69330 [Moorena producens 3L]|uniref:Uncharacterized protein n=1 Tax=Moorena producens 3L TaxID=489825 RepID=F4Y2K4_9CYAN|nr:hypothetical protein LYNGBM3L_69330 [Moorena producens 3L]